MRIAKLLLYSQLFVASQDTGECTSGQIHNSVSRLLYGLRDERDAKTAESRQASLKLGHKDNRMKSNLKTRAPHIEDVRQRVWIFGRTLVCQKLAIDIIGFQLGGQTGRGRSGETETSWCHGGVS